MLWKGAIKTMWIYWTGCVKAVCYSYAWQFSKYKHLTCEEYKKNYKSISKGQTMKHKRQNTWSDTS